MVNFFFKENELRSEVNETLIISKSRHLSMNKSNQSPNNFIFEVFEQLELDFESYLNTVNLVRKKLILYTSRLK